MLWSVVIAGLAVAGGVIAWNFIPRRQRLKRFENRPDLGFDEIYDDFFSNKGLPKELVHELWNEVCTTLDLPTVKLRPTDGFDQELAAPKGWEFDDDIVDLQLASKRRLKHNGTQADLSQIRTVADYVEFFCKLKSP